MGHEKFSPSFAAADWQKYFKKLWAQTALGTRVVSSPCPNTGLSMRRFILDRAKLRIVKVTKGVRSEGRPPLDWGPTIARGEAAAGGRRTAGGGWRRLLELLLAVAAGWVRPRLAQNTCRPTQAPGLQPLLAHCSHTGSPGLFRDTCPCLPSYRRGDHFVNRASSVRTSNILLHLRSHLWS